MIALTPEPPPSEPVTHPAGAVRSRVLHGRSAPPPGARHRQRSPVLCPALSRPLSGALPPSVRRSPILCSALSRPLLGAGQGTGGRRAGRLGPALRMFFPAGRWAVFLPARRAGRRLGRHSAARRPGSDAAASTPMTCPPSALCVPPSVRPSVRPSVLLSVRLSVCPSARLFVCLSVRLSVCTSVCTSVCISYQSFLSVYFS